MKILSWVMLAALLASCATNGLQAPAPDAGQAMIRLYESPCYFPTCLSYDFEVLPSGAYTLTSHPSQQPDVVRKGMLGSQAWARAEAALAEAKFAAMERDLTVSSLSRPGGAPCIHDLPDVTFTRREADGREKAVRFSTGCNVPAARKLLDDLRSIFNSRELARGQ